MATEELSAGDAGAGVLESLLDVLPTPMALIDPADGRLVFANKAADALAGGALPRGDSATRFAADGFSATHPDGRPLTPDEMPSIRAARGERIEGVEVEWHTPVGKRSLLVQSATFPATADRPERILLSFEEVSSVKAAERARTESRALLDALFEGAPVGIGYWDTELRYVRLNEKLAEMNGVPVDDHLGRTVLEVLPDMDPRVEAEFRRVIETGEPAIDIEFVGETPAATGQQKHFSTAIYPVRDPERGITGVGCVVLDITARRSAETERARALELERQAREAAEDAAARARFLSEASVILDESLDYDATLSSVSRLAVPWLADWCAIDMLEADGELRRVTTAHVDPDKVELAKEWHRKYPPDMDAPTGVANVLRTRTSEIYPEISDELIAAAARDEEHLELIRSIGMQAAMVVPIVARGRTLGAITLIAAETGRRYDDQDLMLAEELARRAATSIDNARLYRERSNIARTLQASLLPPHLPNIEGMQVSARYRPVGEGIDVGGDFYDVFDIGDDSWAMVIGDVCGKGAEAAALTALVRYTVRAIATADKLPSEILASVNAAILRQRSDNRFCTMAYARVVRAQGGVRVELSSGGHPLPLIIRANGAAEYAGEAGTLLGVVPDPTLHDVAVDLGPGDGFVLYTDGVTEAGAPDRLMSAEDLIDEVQRCAGADAPELAGCLEQLAVDASGGDPHDDIAILTLNVSPHAQGPEESVPLRAAGAP